MEFCANCGHQKRRHSLPNGECCALHCNCGLFRLRAAPAAEIDQRLASFDQWLTEEINETRPDGDIRKMAVFIQREFRARFGLTEG